MTQESTGSYWFQPLPAYSVAILRIGFAAIMLYWVGSFLAYDKITFFYFEPKFNFRYPGFEWLPRLDLPQFRLLLIVMLVSCFCMMVGFLYRAAATLFSVGFIYIFLLDMTAYQNHYYLVCLLSFLFILVPADSALSIRPTSKWSRQNYNTIPRWALWMLSLIHI